MKSPFYVFLFMFFSIAAYSQEKSLEDKAIIKSIEVLFEGMQKSDTLLLNTVLDKDISFKSVNLLSSIPQLTAHTRTDFYKTLAQMKTMNLDWKEELLGYEIQRDKELAQVWTPYIFYINGEKSHCGANSFHLVKQRGIWVIHSVFDSRRKCD